MKKGRLEAFSDGVIAIIITIMVLEIKVPEGADIDALRPWIARFLSYALSFVIVGIYWNNHHHLLQATHRINGKVMWNNLHLLFWLSLLPVVGGWLGQNPRAHWPAALYGFVLFMAGIAYLFLALAIVAFNGKDSVLATAMKSGLKEKLSAGLYLAAIGLAFVHPFIADGIYVAVAMMWFIPDRRIERTIDRVPAASAASKEEEE
jgi:uncharacterized membrane protein